MSTDQQAQNAVTLVERYGSFGLLCVFAFVVMGGGGWLVWYAVTRLGPRVGVTVERWMADYHAANERRDAVCKQAAETSAKSAEAVAALAGEIRRLTDRTDEHRPLPPKRE